MEGGLKGGVRKAGDDDDDDAAGNCIMHNNPLCPKAYYRPIPSHTYLTQPRSIHVGLRRGDQDLEHPGKQGQPTAPASRRQKL